jgi:hypothetical protein
MLFSVLAPLAPLPTGASSTVIADLIRNLWYKDALITL